MGKMMNVHSGLDLCSVDTNGHLRIPGLGLILDIPRGLGNYPSVHAGADLVSDGDTIAHGFTSTPYIVPTGTVAGEIVTATSRGPTTWTVAIKTNQGEPGTPQVVIWIAVPLGTTLHAGRNHVSDGDTIAHGCATTPYVIPGGSVAGEIVSVAARGPTTWTVAIKTNQGEPGTSQDVDWLAIV